MSLHTYLAISFVIYVLGLLPLLAYYFTPARKNPALAPVKFYLWLLFVGSIEEPAAFYFYRLTHFPGYSAAHWFYIYQVLAVACIYYYYLKILPDLYRLPRRIFLMGFILFNLYLLINLSFKDSYRNVTLNMILLLFFNLTCAFLWFRKIINDPTSASLWQIPDFYFIASFTIFHSGIIILFLFSDFIEKTPGDESRLFWSVSLYLNIVMRLLLLAGVWLGGKITPAFGEKHQP